MAVENIWAIRGATTAENNADGIDGIIERSNELMRAITEVNGVDGKSRRIVSVIASTTADLTAFYPVRALRESGTTAPLFSAVEPPVEGSLGGCIRLLVTVADSEPLPEPKHIYLHGARSLRKDLTEGN